MRISSTKTVLFVLLLTVCFVNIHAVPRDLYTVSAFRTTDRQFPFQGNDIIRSETGGACAEIDTVAIAGPGKLLLRKKYEPGDYRLYKGRIDTTAFKSSLPLYSFPIPKDIPVKSFGKKRLFSQRTADQSLDIDEVYFDAFSFYVRHFSTVYYYHNDKIYSITGKREYPVCRIEISSEPSGAQVVVNGISTVRTTPCVLDNMSCGSYKIELFLPHYHFSQKTISVRADTTAKLSYALMSDFDTMYISGTVPYGVLYFPEPPTDSLFTIDTMTVHGGKAELFAGAYRVKWNGGELYQSIDTVLTVIEGRMSWFDVKFRRKVGMLHIKTIPVDAELCMENRPCNIGARTMELESGVYTLDISHHGYQGIRRTVKVLPDTVNEYTFDLRMNADRDGDGYLDSVDNCPDVYGIYDGCPRPGFAKSIKVKLNEVNEYVKNDRFEFGASLIGYIASIPSNRRFSSFLSSFSGGRIGGVNNYRSLTMLNSYHVMYRALYCGLELGQWASGVKYKRYDTIQLVSDSVNRYEIFFDSLSGIEPAFYLPSTSFSIGVHYNWSWINVIYDIGYQWQDIRIDQIYNVNEERFENVVFDNDWWFHQIHVEADLHADRHFVPSVYFRMKFPFGKVMFTRWYVIQVGLQMKIYPLKAALNHE